jgi:hypothetical protein
MLFHRLFFRGQQHTHIENGVSNQWLLGRSDNESFCDCCDNVHHPQHLVLLLQTGIHRVQGHNHGAACRGLSTFFFVFNSSSVGNLIRSASHCTNAVANLFTALFDDDF